MIALVDNLRIGPLRSRSAWLAAIATLAVACGDGSEDVGGTGRAAAAAATTDPILPEERGSHVGVHGMVLFGSERLYLSHIPLYRAPHDIQVVVEVTIASGVPGDQQQFGSRTFTVKPTAFSLHDLAHGALTSLTGTIYFGNFESGGTPAFRDVRFDVSRVIFERALSPSMAASSTLDYVAVGTPTQPYLVHVIDAPPSFDHIVEARVPEGSFLDASSLEAGALVRIEGRPNTVTRRPRPQTTVVGLALDANGAVIEVDGEAVASPIEIVGENSCLLGRDFYRGCPPAQ